MIVPRKGNKKIGYGPDIPEGLLWKSYHENEDGTYTIILSEEYYEKERESIKAASQFIIADKILKEEIPIEEMERFKGVFDPPIAGQKYKLDWILKDPVSGDLFRIAQPEVTWQKHWKIDEITSIVTPYRKEGEILAWKQPLSTNPYRMGDRATHNGKTWESMNDANVWEPGTVDDRIWKEVI